MSFIAENDFFIKYRDESLFNDKNSVQEFFKYFDKDMDNHINLKEFEDVLKSLFSYNGKPYPIDTKLLNEMFEFYDSQKDHQLDFQEMEKFWFEIVKQMLLSRSSFVIVDVQNDFIDGTLALKNCPAKQDGADVLNPINQLIDTVPFDVVTYTLDWHPKDHCSFYENLKNRKISSKSQKKENIQCYDLVVFEDMPNVEQKLWPAHCVQDSEGAKLHPKLKVVDENTDSMKRKVVYAYKGSRPDIDSYSAFFDNCKLNQTSLHDDLQKHKITDIYVCGLAADVCVAATSAHGLDLKYRVIYIEDAVSGVDVKDIEAQKKKLVDGGALMVTTNKVRNMVLHRDRRPELGYATFMALKNSAKN